MIENIFLLKRGMVNMRNFRKSDISTLMIVNLRKFALPETQKTIIGNETKNSVVDFYKYSTGSDHMLCIGEHNLIFIVTIWNTSGR